MDSSPKSWEYLRNHSQNLGNSEKESQKVDASVFLKRKNKTFMGGNKVTNGRARIGKKVIQKWAQ